MEIAAGLWIVVVTPLIAAVLAGFVVYWLSGRRAQKEWRAQKQAEVVSEIYRLLSGVQTTATMATIPGVSLEVRKQRIMANRKALQDLSYYLHAHTLWIDARSLPTIKAFVDGLVSALGPYEAELHRGAPDSPLAIGAAEHVLRIVPEAEAALEREFHAIVYPKTWREYLASGLEWLETRKRRSARSVPNPQDGEDQA